MTALTSTTELTFGTLGVRDEIVRALSEKGIESPFAIQELTMPLALAGGPTLAGSTKRIRVQRAGKELDHVTLDDPVQPEDVLIIREKLF